MEMWKLALQDPMRDTELLQLGLELAVMGNKRAQKKKIQRIL